MSLYSRRAWRPPLVIHRITFCLFKPGLWHEASRKEKKALFLSVWSLQSTKTNLPTIVGHSKWLIRMRSAKLATKLRKICRVGFQGEMYNRHTLEGGKKKKRMKRKRNVAKNGRGCFLIVKTRSFYLLIRDIVFMPILFVWWRYYL